MAIAIVNSGQTASGSASSLTIPSATAGNVLVAFLSQLTSVLAPSATGYTVNGTSCTFGVAGVDGGFVMYKVAAGGETSIAPTAGTGGTITGICYWELSGCSTTVDTIVATNTTGSISTLASNSFSTSNSGSIILCGVPLATTSGVVKAWTSTVLTNIATTASRCFGGSLIPGTTEIGITPTANWTTAARAGLLALALEPSGAVSDTSSMFLVL